MIKDKNPRNESPENVQSVTEAILKEQRIGNIQEKEEIKLNTKSEFRQK